MKPLVWISALFLVYPARAADVQALLVEAMSYKSAGQLDRAEAILRQILDRDPRHAYAWQQRALIAVSRDQVDRGGEYFARALALEPDNPFLIKWNGLIALYQGELERALTLFKGLAEEASSKIDQADAYFFMGAIYSLRRDTDQALDLFKRSSTFKSDPSTTLRLARAYHDLGRYKLAERHYKEAIAATERPVGALNDLGWLYYTQGRFDEAVDQWRRVLAIDSSNREAHNSLGKAFNDQGLRVLRQGHRSEARRLWKNALTYDSNNKATKWFLAHY